MQTLMTTNQEISNEENKENTVENGENVVNEEGDVVNEEESEEENNVPLKDALRDYRTYLIPVIVNLSMIQGSMIGLVYK
mmetsp:Transcript_26673/g.23551  ORF Transcript_26673/g.23551 Transcript_26673/m.23551 type:complete len:80 (-) Transcript_26673:484-723(-)